MKDNTTKLHAAYISIIIILLIIMVGGFYYMHKKAEAMRMGMNPTGMKQGMMMVPMGKGGRGMAMVAATPPPVSDQQTEQLTAGTSSATTQKTFNITGGNFYFVPNKITVNKGDQVTLVMTNAGGVHDLVIDELGVKTPVIHTAQAATATFTATKTGSFVYYCDITGHKAKGMFGILTVQ